MERTRLPGGESNDPLKPFTDPITYDLPPGLYELKNLVRNPRADRRKRRDWTAVEFWPAGMRFNVVHRAPSWYTEAEGRYTAIVSIEVPGKHDSVHVGHCVSKEDSDEFLVELHLDNEVLTPGAVLVADLVPVPLTLLTMCDWFPNGRTYHAGEVLTELARRGLITANQAINVLRALDSDSFFPEDQDDE